MVSPSSLTFSNSNWDSNQTVTVTGVDDAVEDGHKNYIIELSPATSDDLNFSGINPEDITIMNIDNEYFPGLPFTEDFAADNLIDSSKTNVDLNTAEQKVRLAAAERIYPDFSVAEGVSITDDLETTQLLTVGDINGDGHVDIVAGSDSFTKYYLNSGSRAAPFADTEGITITDQSHAVALGDMDGDGDLDLISGGLRDFTTPPTFLANRLFLNNGTATPFAGVTGLKLTNMDSNNIEFDNHSLAIGDVDGDGHIDVVTGSHDHNVNGTNHLWLNNGTSNPFDGVMPSNITNDSDDTFSIALGDVDNDGDLDVVTGNKKDQNRLYLNNGTATPFSDIVDGSVVYVTGMLISEDELETFSIVLGDINGDGFLDVVTGDSTGTDATSSASCKYYLNNGTSNPFVNDTGVLVTGIDINEPGFAISIDVGDMDGDGDLDLISGGLGDSSTPSIVNRIFLNNGASDPSFTSVDIPGSAGLDTTVVVLSDINGDGKLDFISGNYAKANLLHLNNGTVNPLAYVTGVDLPSDPFNGFNDRSNNPLFAFGYVNNDDSLDIVTASNGVNNLYLSNGTSAPYNGVSGSNITSDAHNTVAIGLGDIDNDGDLDVIAINQDQEDRLYLNDGDGSSFTGVNISADTDISGNLYLGDFNGDGDLDILVGKDRLYLNDGTGSSFTVMNVVGIPDATFGYRFALGDIDGDGDLDVADQGGFYLNDGSGLSFTVVNLPDSAPDFIGPLALDDINSDGELDMVIGHPFGVNQVILNDGSPVDPFATVTGITFISEDNNDTQSMAVGDINNDNKPDIIIGNFTEQVNRVYINNGDPDDPFNHLKVIKSNISDDNFYTFYIFLGDVDGDGGDLDVVAGDIDFVNNVFQYRLYLNPFETNSGDFQNHRGTIISETINTGEIILSSELAASTVLPLNTRIDFYLSNNGGETWYQVKSNDLEPFEFPLPGIDLRWRAELHSLSPMISPTLTSVTITGNAAPTGIQLTQSFIAENITEVTNIGTLTVTDAGGPHKYSLPAGVLDNDLFQIPEIPEFSTTLQSKAGSPSPFDFEDEDKNSYLINIRVEDEFQIGFEQQFFISIVDAPDAPTAITLNGGVSESIDESQPPNTFIGNLDAVDEDNSSFHFYELPPVGVNDNSSFSIDFGTKILKSAERFDFETKDSYLITIKVADAGFIYTQDFTINIGDVSDGVTVNINPLTETEFDYGESVSIKASVASDASGALKTATATFRFSNSLPFVLADIVDPVNLASKFKGVILPDNPALLHIRGQLSASTIALLDAYTAGTAPTDALKTAIIDELELLLNDANLFTPASRFADIGLFQSTLDAINLNPSVGDDLRRRNKSLLEFLFDGELAVIEESAFITVGGDPVSISYTPSLAGKWQVIIGWAGTTDYDAGQSVPVLFQFNKTDTILELFHLGAAQIFEEARDIPGRLALVNRNPGEVDISGLEISTTISKDLTTGTFTTTTDSVGNFSLAVPVKFFNAVGTWKVITNFAGNNNLNSSDFGVVNDEKEIVVRKAYGYAILVQGSTEDREGALEHKNTLDFAESSFLAAGLTPLDIKTITVDTPNPKEKLREYIEVWAKNKMLGKIIDGEVIFPPAPAPLYILLLNHGSAGVFHMFPDILSPLELDDMLDNLQDSLARDSEVLAVEQSIVTILGMCFSGSFIPGLSPQLVHPDDNTIKLDNTRITISAAAAEEFSIRGQGEEGLRQGEQFVYLLFRELNKGLSLTKSFMNSQTGIQRLSADRTLTINPNGSIDFPGEKGQHPRLDDNGDGVADKILLQSIPNEDEDVNVEGDEFLDGDGVLADKVFLTAPTNALPSLPIDRVGPSVFLAADDDIPARMLFAELDLKPEKVRRVYMEIKRVEDDNPVDPDSTMQHVVVFTEEPMEFYFNGDFVGYQWPFTANPNPNNLFSAAGTYQVFFYAESIDEHAEISDPVERTVYRAPALSTPPVPTAFNLLSPPNNEPLDFLPGNRNKNGFFSWERSSSCNDCGQIRYTFRLWEDLANNKSNLIFESRNLTTPNVIVDAVVVEDFKTYRWDVVAVDGKGNFKESNDPDLIFTVSKGNPDTIYLTINLVDEVSPLNTPQWLSGASFTATPSLATLLPPDLFEYPDGSGSYPLDVHQQTEYSITITKDGYLNKTLDNVKIGSSNSERTVTLRTNTTPLTLKSSPIDINSMTLTVVSTDDTPVSTVTAFVLDQSQLITTDYTIEFTANLVHTEGSNDYNFKFWRLNEVDQTLKQTTLSTTIDKPITVEAVYELDAGQVLFSQANYNAFEQDRFAVIPVDKAASAAGESFAVNYTLSAMSAVENTDYIASTGTLNFSTSDERKFVFIEILENLDDDGDNTLSVELRKTDGTFIVATTLSINDDEQEPYQEISPTFADMYIGLDADFEIGVNYNTVPVNSALTGIGIRMQFDSTKLTWDSDSFNLTGGLNGATNKTLNDDSANNYDQDPTTDKFVQITWSDPTSNFPGSLPMNLFKTCFTMDNVLTPGQRTFIRFSEVSSAPSYNFRSKPIVVEVIPGSFDIDGNGKTDTFTDGIMIVRHIFGFTGSSLISGSVADDATRSSSTDIEAFLAKPVFDIDGSGLPAVGNRDGKMIVRYLAEFRGSALISNAVDSDNCSPSLCSADDIAKLIGKYSFSSPCPVSPSSSARSSRSARNARSSNEQVITSVPSEFSILPDSSISVDIMYSTSPADQLTEGVQIRLHFDSSKLTFNGLTDVLQNELLGTDLMGNDTNFNYDNDVSTKNFINVVWFDFDSNPSWPGSGDTLLFQANFTASSDFSGSTAINFSTGSTANGFSFNAQSVFIVKHQADWSLTVNSNDSESITFGMSNTTPTNDGLTSAPIGSKLNLIRDAAPLQGDIRPMSQKDYWKLMVDARSAPIQLTWNSNVIPDDKFISLVEVDENDNLISAGSVTLNSINTLSIPSGGKHYFQLPYAPDITFTAGLFKGWNLFSLPLTPTNPSVTNVFGSQDSSSTAAFDGIHPNAIWGWGNGKYSKIDSLEALHAYWVYSDNATLLTVKGLPVAKPASGTVSMQLEQGWNMCGPASPFPIVYPLAHPLQGIVWSWDGTKYEFTEMMRCFKGYWINSAEDNAVFNLE